MTRRPGEPPARQGPTSILIERLRQDLEQSRTQGLDLPQTPEGFLADWLRAGSLERSYVAGVGRSFWDGRKRDSHPLKG